MKIIRDEELQGLLMIPLFVDWNIRRCNVQDCRNKPTTIITQIEGIPIFGLCESHFQEGNKTGEICFQLEWDNFNAFIGEKESAAAKKIGTPLGAHSNKETSTHTAGSPTPGGVSATKGLYNMRNLPTGGSLLNLTTDDPSTNKHRDPGPAVFNKQ